MILLIYLLELFIVVIFRTNVVIKTSFLGFSDSVIYFYCSINQTKDFKSQKDVILAWVIFVLLIHNTQIFTFKIIHFQQLIFIYSA